MINIITPDFEFEDDRGKLVQLVRDGWKQVNVINSYRGTLRGGHYHKNNAEAFYIIDGELKLTLSKENKSEEHVFKNGDMFVILPNVVHSFKFITDTLLVSMYSHGVEEENGMDMYSAE